MALPLAAIGLGLAAAGSLAQVIQGETRRVKARRALENFQRQELKNITEGLRVSTLGAELQTQEAQRRFATSVDALRSGGVRGVVGGLGQQEMQQQRLQQQISADLDRQQIAIEQMRAQDEARIRSMIETRETGQIAGLGEEMAQGARMAQAGLGGLASTGLAAYRIQSLTGNGAGSAAGSAAGGGSSDSTASNTNKGSALNALQYRALQSDLGLDNVSLPLSAMQAYGSQGRVSPLSRGGISAGPQQVYLDQFNTQGITFRD